ncbi:recombinase family protein [Corynebacterium sp. YIM 101645]|uniref:Recombinase family protein n=1 Tax=Corynebacterium lemuris TaxID=1859292 RepID=A0ABT2FTW1_9CORY|nr:recombinase family protein [Corynebacterium lemuris]MCS5478404.1 recombinase family protein [Corynebacterium lemuris]
MTTNHNAAVIYARLSQRRDDGAADHSPAIERQVALCRQLATDHGLEVTATHVDDGVSAWAATARPGFETLLSDVTVGRARVVLAYAPDRLARNLGDYARLFDAAKRARVVFKFVVGGDVDPRDANQDFMSGVSALVSAHESALKSTRVRAANDQRAAQGRVHRGKRTFGYAANGVDLEPREAEALREVARRILAGDSLRSCARWLNEVGVLTAGGKAWAANTLKYSLLRPTLAGYIVHRGEVIEGVVGEQAAIFTEAEHAQLKAALATRARPDSRPNHRRGRAPSTLGTGLYRCICGETMTASRDKQGVDAYRCRATLLPKREGKHTTRRREPVDDLVGMVIAARLDSGDVQRLLAAQANDAGEGQRLAARRDEVRAELDDLADAVVSRALTVKQAATISTGLQAELGRLDAALAAADNTGVLELVGGVVDGQAWWNEASLEARRTLVSALVTVTLLPSKRGPGFKPESVGIEWKI